MAAKSAISGEYIIQKEDSGSIVVYRIYDNTKGALREVAEEKNFQYDPNWTTRQFGNKICKEFGDGKEAIVGCYNIRVQESGTIEVFRTYDNTKAALREIAGNVGFEFDPNWNTQQFGSKLIDFVNSK